MDFIPTFHFVSAIMIFGLLLYVFNPVVSYLQSVFPVSTVYATAIFWLWGALAFFNLVGSGIRFIMKMQERRGY